MFLLDGSHNLLLRTRVKYIATLPKQQLHVFRHISPSDVDSLYTVWHREAFVDRYRVRNTIAGIKNYTCCAARGVE